MSRGQPDCGCIGLGGPGPGHSPDRSHDRRHDPGCSMQDRIRSGAGLVAAGAPPCSWIAGDGCRSGCVHQYRAFPGGAGADELLRRHLAGRQHEVAPVATGKASAATGFGRGRDHASQRAGMRRMPGRVRLSIFRRVRPASWFPVHDRRSVQREGHASRSASGAVSRPPWRRRRWLAERRPGPGQRDGPDTREPQARSTRAVGVPLDLHAACDRRPDLHCQPERHDRPVRLGRCRGMLRPLLPVGYGPPSLKRRKPAIADLGHQKIRRLSAGGRLSERMSHPLVAFAV